jgi:small-conductance mechanosensitive channel
MEAIKIFLQFDWLYLAIPLSVLAITITVGFIAKRLLFSALYRWARKTKTRADDILVETLSGPFMMWVLILALNLAVQSSDLPDRITGLIGKILLILWVISLTLVVSRLAANLIKHSGHQAQGVLPVTSLTQNLARIVVITIGLLILLNQLGISVTPILTALGVGGLAVALALQDTLSNLFAGFYVSLSGHIRPGDYIKLESSEEGYVTDIGWRSTMIRAIPNNMIIIPNAKLAQAIVTNYHLPGKVMTARFSVGVSYESDPEKIERILIEEAKKAIGEIPGLLPEPAPFVRFIPGFGESSLDFTLYYQVAEFEYQNQVQHELRKRIFKRFREAGIDIPFPIRTVYLHDEAKHAMRHALNKI